MTKSERLFEVLQYIREYPHLTARDLAKLCNISERGIYRYINTLSRAGFSIRFQEGGYKLLESESGLLERASIEALRAVRKLLSMGMSHCRDDELIGHGKAFMELMDKNLPRTKGKMFGDMMVVPEKASVTNYGGTVTIGHSSKPGDINPILTAETISVSLMPLIFSGLVGFDASQRPAPDIAKSWEVSSDGLEWTFFLRNDVRFHDGHPLTAHDVEFTYRTILNPENKSPWRRQCIMIDRLEAESDYVFKAVLKYPFAPFIRVMSWAIAPRHLLENTDLHNTPLNRQPVGSGPFKLADWAKDGTITLEANREYHFKGRPILNSLIFKTYPDRQIALQAITQGEMDMALNLAAADLAFINRRGAFRVYSAPGSSNYAIFFNLNDPLFKDARVREALDYAIDRDSIITNQLKGYSKICTGPFGVNSWAYNSDVQPTPYNIEKAKELLEQAGWRYSDSNGLLDKDDKLFEIGLTIPNISDSLERVAVAIVAQLMKIGIKVNLIYADDSELYETPFQTILCMTVAGADPDYAYKAWHSKNGDRNLASYENEFVDHLLELGRQTANMEKRKVIYHKIHRRIHDDYPAIFLASGREFIGSNYRFQNAAFSSTLYFLTTAKNWQITGKEKEGVKREYRRKIGVIS